MLEIYHVESRRRPWDISNVAKDEAEKARARAIYDRLAAIKPAHLTFRQWTIDAGLNTSFFTNLKNGSAPSIYNLEAILKPIGMSLVDFLAGGAPSDKALPNEATLAWLFEGMLEGIQHTGPVHLRAEALAGGLQLGLGLLRETRATRASAKTIRELGRVAVARSSDPTIRALPASSRS